MNIPLKYEDVVAKLDAALGREAALREDNERLHKLYPDERRRSIDFHNAICRIQDQQRVWLMRFGAKYGDSTDLKLFDELRKRDAETAALQQSLTVADQRAGELEALLLESNELLYVIQDGLGGNLWSAVDVLRGKVFTALKSAADGAKNCPNCKVCMGSPGFPENCLINGVKP